MVENPPKINQKAIQKVIKNKMRFWMHLGWLLGRFLVDFGSKLGGKLRPSWHQNPTKSDTKTIAKNNTQKGAEKVVRAILGSSDKLWVASWGPLRVLQKGVPEALEALWGTRNTPLRAQGPGADMI